MLRVAVVGLLAACAAVWVFNRRHPVSPGAFLSTKAPYPAPDAPWVGGEAAATCRLVHVNHLGRHGSRHLTKLKKGQTLIKMLEGAEAKGALTAQGKATIADLQMFLDGEAAGLGNLTPAGVQELHDQGVRFANALRPHLQSAAAAPKDLQFDATFKLRAQDSRDAYIAGMRKSADALGAPLPEIVVNQPPACEAGAPPPEALHNLRFFDSCEAYLQFSDSKQWKPKVRAILNGAGESNSSALKELRAAFAAKLVKPGFDSGKSADDFNAKLVSSMYAMCQIEWGTTHGNSPLCSLFTDSSALLGLLEFETDLTAYHKKGAGHDVAYMGACRLLEDFFSDADDALASQSTFGHFRFAHAETVMPLITLLQLYDVELPAGAHKYNLGGLNLSGRPWVGTGATMVPMGANMVWFLYDCGTDGLQVAVSHNEREARFPACPHSSLCPWETVKEYYRGVYNKLGMGTCSMEDWAARCGGVAVCPQAGGPSLVD